MIARVSHADNLLSSSICIDESLAASQKCHFRVRHFGRVFSLPYKITVLLSKVCCLSVDSIACEREGDRLFERGARVSTHDARLHSLGSSCGHVDPVLLNFLGERRCAATLKPAERLLTRLLACQPACARAASDFELAGWAPRLRLLSAILECAIILAGSSRVPVQLSCRYWALPLSISYISVSSPLCHD